MKQNTFTFPKMLLLTGLFVFLPGLMLFAATILTPFFIGIMNKVVVVLQDSMAGSIMVRSAAVAMFAIYVGSMGCLFHKTLRLVNVLRDKLA